MRSALIAALLLAGLLLLLPVRLSIDLRKDGQAVQGGYRLAWLGVAVKRSETGGEVKAGPKEGGGAIKPPAPARLYLLPSSRRYPLRAAEKDQSGKLLLPNLLLAWAIPQIRL